MVDCGYGPSRGLKQTEVGRLERRTETLWNVQVSVLL